MWRPSHWLHWWMIARDGEQNFHFKAQRRFLLLKLGGRAKMPSDLNEDP
jgi:hypothetical protein